MVSDAAFLATIADNPNSLGPQLVYADWLEEAGDARAAAWRIPAATAFPIGLFSVPGFCGIGRGSGIGSGSGSGIGIGSGSGIGRGSGRGIGIGIGRGSGIGIGRGIIPCSGADMIVGKNYLIHCGDWHTFVGRCARQIAPLIFEIEQVSKIADTRNGDNWHELAAGDKAARRACDFKHYTTTACVPLSVIAFEWVGELPSR